MRFPFVLLICAAITACNTPIPPIGASSPAGIAYHGNIKSAGIYGSIYCQGVYYGLLVDDEYVANYKADLKVASLSLHAPADPFSDLVGPACNYIVKFKGKDGKLNSMPVWTFIATSTLWPISSTTHAVTNEGASAYEAMNRASKL